MLLVVVALSGCKEADEIRSYQAPRVEGRSVQLIPPQYETPAGWARQPREKAKVSLFLQTYLIGEGKEQANFTLTAMGGRGRLLDDINRWRGKEVGLPPVDELPKDLRKIKVADTESDYVDLTGPEKRMLTVILVREPYVWYFKLAGPKETVTAQQDGFEKLLRSVRFSD